jgi:hypothetical protein
VRAAPRGRLLQDVGQEAAAGGGRDVRSTRAEDDVAPDSVRLGVAGLGGQGRVGPGMDPHPREVAPEPRFEQRPDWRVERGAGQRRDLVARRVHAPGRGGRPAGSSQHARTVRGGHHDIVTLVWVTSA